MHGGADTEEIQVMEKELHDDQGPSKMIIAMSF